MEVVKMIQKLCFFKTHSCPQLHDFESLRRQACCTVWRNTLGWSPVERRWQRCEDSSAAWPLRMWRALGGTQEAIASSVWMNVAGGVAWELNKLCTFMKQVSKHSLGRRCEWKRWERGRSQDESKNGTLHTLYYIVTGLWVILCWGWNLYSIGGGESHLY